MKKILFTLICLQSTFMFGQNNDFKWAKSFSGSGHNYGTSMALDAAGNSYTGGHFLGTSDLDPGTSILNVTSNGYSDAYICKLDHLGNFLWAKHIGGTGDDQILSVTVDVSGNVYATGHFTETVDFDPGTGVSNRTSQGGRNVFVLKLDTNGDFLWVKTFGGTDMIYGDIGNSIALDDSGNVYVTGAFRGVVDFDPGTGVSNMTTGGFRNGFISKFDSTGNFVWAKGFIAPAGSEVIPKSIALDPQGNIYTAGALAGTADFDPGTGTHNLTSQGGSDAFVAKLNASGNLVWAKNWGGTSNNGVLSLALDASQNVYTTGYFMGTTDFDPSVSGSFEASSNVTQDIFVSKLNSTGNFVWAKTFGGSNQDEGRSIFTINGSVYVTGFFRITVDFDPDPVNTYNLTASGLSSDIFILKMNDLGQFIWAEQISSTSTDYGNGIVVDSTDNIFITGYFRNTADFDPDPVDTFEMTSSPSMYGAFVLKLGNNCSPVNHSISETACSSFTWTSGNGNTYTSSTSVAHTFAGAANGCDSIVTLNLTIEDLIAPVANTTNLSDITGECSVSSLTAPTATDNCAGSITGTHNTTLPISTQGTTVVTWTYDDGNGNTSTQTQNVIITPINNGLTQSGAVTLSADATGYNYQWVDCNNGNQAINGATNQTFVATANGNYAVEIDNGSCTVTSSCVVVNQVGIEENSSSNVLIYPNPTKGEITISGIDLNTTIEIYNSVGELLKSITATESTTMVSISDYSLGVYYVKLKNSSTESIQKLVKH